MATSLDELERLGDLLAQPAPSKRMLIIVNPYATTVSDRLKNLVVYALRGRYQVDAVETQSRDHATALSREAAHEGYDIVVAFGGDGTVNEAAHGLAGSRTPLGVLPGGATNVYARVLGVPNEIVDATEHLLAPGRRLAPAAGRPRGGQRPPLPVLGRARPGRERGRARRRPPLSQGEVRRVVLHLGGAGHLQPPLPAQPAPDRRALGRRGGPRGDRHRPERAPVHVLQQAPDRDRRGRRARLGRRWPARCCDARARSTCRR